MSAIDSCFYFCFFRNPSPPLIHLLSWAVVVLGSSSLWLRLLRAVECWLAVVSKDDADTPSLRGAILGAEGESDFTAGPVAPENKSFGLRAATGNLQGSASAQLEESGDLGLPSVLPTSYTLMIVFYISLYPHTTIGSAKSFKTYR